VEVIKEIIKEVPVVKAPEIEASLISADINGPPKPVSVGKKKKMKVKIDFKYNPERYENKKFIPEAKSAIVVKEEENKAEPVVEASPLKGANPFDDLISFDVAEKKEEVPVAVVGKRKKIVKLDFKYNAERYENKKFIPDKKPVIEEAPKAVDPTQNVGRRKKIVKLNFQYDASRYEDKKFVTPGREEEIRPPISEGNGPTNLSSKSLANASSGEPGSFSESNY